MGSQGIRIATIGAADFSMALLALVATIGRSEVHKDADEQIRAALLQKAGHDIFAMPGHIRQSTTILS